MAAVDDLAERLEAACANHIRFHNRSDADLTEIRRGMWRVVANTIVLLVDERLAGPDPCLKTPRRPRRQ